MHADTDFKSKKKKNNPNPTTKKQTNFATRTFLVVNVYITKASSNQVSWQVDPVLEINLKSITLIKYQQLFKNMTLSCKKEVSNIDNKYWCFEIDCLNFFISPLKI